MVSQEENHKIYMITKDERGEATAFAVKQVTRVQSVAERIPCKHCGQVGHEELRCNEIIGYPPSRRTR